MGKRTLFPKIKGVEVTDDTCWGSPRFAGTRLTIETICSCLCGDSEQNVMEGYGVTPEQMRTYHQYMRAMMFRNWADNAREVYNGS